MEDAKIVIIAATVWEMRPFIRSRKLKSSDGRMYVGEDRNLVVLICGIGGKAAAKAAQEALRFCPQAIVSTGYAGSLQPQVEVGDLVLDTHKSDAALAEKVKSVAARSKLKLHCGTLFCADKTLESAQEKQQVSERNLDLAVEMESGAIAAVCAQNNVAFLSLRAISDGMHQPVPECVNGIDPFGKINPRWVLYFLSQPGQWKDFFRLVKTSKKAEKSLAKFLENWHE